MINSSLFSSNKDDYRYLDQFTDIKSSHWFAPAVQWAYDNKITSGKTATTFAPNENITREQLAAMLCRYAEYKGMEIANTKDISAFPVFYNKDMFEAAGITPPTAEEPWDGND